MKFLEGLSNSFWSDHTAITNLQGGGGEPRGPASREGTSVLPWAWATAREDRLGVGSSRWPGVGDRGWLREHSVLMTEIVSLLSHRLQVFREQPPRAAEGAGL